ncbi:hypothetical protein [Clostridium scatologenes]|uniref:Uncharacterized protein n=1 Tax=Clostridium scatologenes TaxID=1548 RepID=A0A0E3JQU1_CLOSL|nr:hypothetical protein [Clostridium scatologenes]AKA71229.1 hypothetical protein CSCA_4104 [Clostridium scatologenes]
MIEYIVKKLERNNIKCNTTANGYGGEDISFIYNLRTYKVQIDEENNMNLLEFSLANNRYKKERYHRVGSFLEVGILIEFIKTKV